MEFGGRLDKWLDPQDSEPCPQCEEGHIVGDRYEWQCSENCGYGGDNFPDDL